VDVSDLVRPGILKRLARSPACHFVVVGILLFLADGVWSRLGATSAARMIVLTGADVRRLRRSFEQQFGRAPNPREEAALVDHAIDEEVLYRRALELGLDRGNRVVRQRLVATMRLVADDVAKDDESLYREALRLQLDRTDVVVRRHLVQLVSLLLKRAGAIGPIREADLRRLLERDADRYRRAETITFTQVYLDPARRGARLEADTARILAALRSGRCYLAMDSLAPARGFRFEVRGREPVEMGAEAPLGADHVLSARVPRAAELTLVREKGP